MVGLGCAPLSPVRVGSGQGLRQRILQFSPENSTFWYTSKLAVFYMPRSHALLRHCNSSIRKYADGILHNKKFEPMLMRCAKAYSSSCSQTISLSAAISLYFILGAYNCSRILQK